MKSEIVLKAKRRIKHFLESGKKQHRVTVEDNEKDLVFHYRVKTGQPTLKFKADKLGRLRQVKAS